MDQRLIAFWAYDQAPYVLSSEVVSFKASGKVEVKGYGGACFEPLKILPYDEGIKIKEQLEELGRDTRLKLADVYAECKNAVNDLLEGRK